MTDVAKDIYKIVRMKSQKAPSHIQVLFYTLAALINWQNGSNDTALKFFSKATIGLDMLGSHECISELIDDVGEAFKAIGDDNLRRLFFIEE